MTILHAEKKDKDEDGGGGRKKGGGGGGDEDIRFGKFKHEISWRMFSGSTYLTAAVTLLNLQSGRLQMAERGQPNQCPSQRGAVRGERGIEGQLRMAIGHCKLTKRSVTKGSHRL